jgi:hypothetical protein
MSEIYCLYGQTFEDGVTYGGAVTMKTRQGVALVAFATAEVAQYFARCTDLSRSEILPVSALGDSSHPLKSKSPLPFPTIKIVFPSEDVVAEWAAGKEKFDFLQYVSALTARSRTPEGTPNE